MKPPHDQDRPATAGGLGQWQRLNQDQRKQEHLEGYMFLASRVSRSSDSKEQLLQLLTACCIPAPSIGTLHALCP